MTDVRSAAFSRNERVPSIAVYTSDGCTALAAYVYHVFAVDRKRVRHKEVVHRMAKLAGFFRCGKVSDGYTSCEI